MAVLWDLDGTLIDSEPYWIAAEIALAERFSVTWTHADGMTLVGKPLMGSAHILRDRGVDLPVEEIVDELLGSVTARMREHVPWQADALALLHSVRAAGIPCALVTMSYRRMAQAALDALPDVFDVVVTGDQVTQGKPHPEAYLTAAAQLGVPIDQCVAIEDSPSGVRSGHASGAYTLGVQRLVEIPALEGMSRVRTLEGWDVAALDRMCRGVVVDELADDAHATHGQ